MSVFVILLEFFFLSLELLQKYYVLCHEAYKLHSKLIAKLWNPHSNSVNHK